MLAATFLAGAAPGAQAEEVPLGLGHRLVDHYEGAPGTARPVPGKGTAQHPYLVPNGRSGMHADGAGSGTHPYPGPLGRDPKVDSEKIAPVGGECATPRAAWFSPCSPRRALLRHEVQPLVKAVLGSEGLRKASRGAPVGATKAVRPARRRADRAA
ncbi:hypothetical protein ASE09_26610 [Streptomyces sp. Root66D1]|nr:hypothetical protein ASD33_29800 [Streptomyces sp. Root1304]KRA97063.1 hypothetical protein ASE09_26610 [Streptomyces sp. Root66D1]